MLTNRNYLTCAGLVAAVLLTVFTETEGKVYPDRVYENYTNHPCIRPCGPSSRPMECVYNFYLEFNVAFGSTCLDCPRNMSNCYNEWCITADGFTRWIMTVNKQLPGPAIHVCQGDTIVVRVTNDLVDTSGTSIHWHGLHQRGFQHMDGTSRITQCEIPVTSSFEYRFPANDPGTHLWHSHSGSQSGEGIHGALVVRQPPELEPHQGLYDRDLPDHTIMVMDWLKRFTMGIWVQNEMGTPPTKYPTILVNGRRVEEEFFTNPENRTSRNFLPMATFTVERGLRYRFRVIDSGMDECPIQISVDGHNLTMIASDGSPFEPIEVESFYIHSGERYDFVLHANQDVGNYWIRFQGSEYSCGLAKAYAAAILRYVDATDEYPSGKFTSYEDAARSGVSLNKWNVLASAENVLLTNLTGLEAIDQEALKEVPDKKFYMQMELNLKYNYRGTPGYWSMINNIVNREPPVPPLTQLQDIDEDLFCNEDTLGDVDCSKVYCECIYRIKVALGDVVELVVVDEGVEYTAVHPMHLHGYKYYVVGMGKLGDKTTMEEVKRLDRENKLSRNLHDPVAKDTVTTNDGGYIILRWHATNPGFWLFHCHVAFHLLEGQGVIFQVGEASEMPPVPKNFPRCGAWKFTGYEQDTDQQCTSTSGSANVWTGLWMLVIFMLNI